MKGNNTVLGHLFAVYSSSLYSFPLNAIIEGMSIVVRDDMLWNRLVNILRLKRAEQVILFNENYHILGELEAATFENKKKVHIRVKKSAQNISWAPSITLALGLTKPEALEEIAALCTQFGVERLIPLFTTKVHRKWGGQKEMDRLFKIMVAAAEQSKNYRLPMIEPPIHISDFIEKSTAGSVTKAFFEVGGRPLIQLLKQCEVMPAQEITVVVGPEGGLTPEEQESLCKASFERYQLTQTILRSVQAVAVGVGSIRSVARDF